jgi:hypothetical protein
VFRAHRGKTFHGFYAHKARPHSVFRAHAIHALKVAKRKNIAAAKPRKPTPYKSLFHTPAAYKPLKKPAKYKSLIPAPPSTYKRSKHPAAYRAAVYAYVTQQL